jgi:hypothetical protein
LTLAPYDRHLLPASPYKCTSSSLSTAVHTCPIITT